MSGGDRQSLIMETNMNRLLMQETSAADELQDIADHVREHRNYDITGERIMDEEEISNDRASPAKGQSVVLDGEVSYDQIVFNLKSYLHACINANMLDKAHNTFIWYRYRMLRLNDTNVPALDAPVYNVLLKAWANAGKTNKVKELFRLMALANISPNLRSYSFYLLSIARQQKFDEDLVKKIVEEMQTKGFSIERIFQNTVMNSEQRKLVEKMLIAISPDIRFNRGPVIDVSDVSILRDYRGSHYPERVGVEVNDLRRWCNEQISHEKQGFVKMKRVYSEECVTEAEDLRKIWDKHEIEWRNVLKEKITGNLLIYKNRHMELQGINIYPYLAAVDTNDLIDIVTQHLTNLDCITDQHSPPSVILYRTLGARVEAKYLSNALIKSGMFADRNRVYNKYLEDIVRPQLHNSRVMLLRKARQLAVSMNSDYREMVWPNPVMLSVGRFLYDIILNDLKVDANAFSKKESVKPVPVIFSFYKTDKQKVREEVRPHPIFSRLQKSICGSELIFDVAELPMLCPPLPWISPSTGGYLIMPTPFVREFHHSSTKSVPVKQFVAVMDAMNSLQLQPWIVNKRILDVMITVFQAKGDEKLDIPLHHSALPQAPKRDSSLTAAERHALFKQIARLRREKSEMYSLWCDCLYKLSIANHLRDRTFWLPHNLDFRGRVYSVPPHLQHLGGDLSRGLLLFATGKPLGADGLQWLKKHLINLTGSMKQSSIAERIDYADEIMPDILDSADHPLDGRRWWTKSDDPWQTLACCMEIADALRSPDPHAFVSHFPVHQDGSCNGLQHYAALGRDQHGAESVNLVPFDRPQDVYSVVADLVEKERQSDAENGVSVAQALEGFVKRKVVKRTVMTFVYGVTRYGARLQILKELRDMDDFPKELEWLASAYLMFQVFASIEKMFTATREIQDWFTECAALLSKNLSQPVRWVTPLGFPVTQPYYKQTPAGTLEVRQSLRPVSQSPNSRKQKNGFPPNFIHSLDSTHMMLTALSCESERLAFVSVHDCYWTHACDVDTMNRICRQQFVRLHSQPILSDLAENFVRQYAAQLQEIAVKSPESYRRILHVLSRAPKTGTLRLDQVLDSVYFFS
jgi:DNA-directed RNA polymerase